MMAARWIRAKALALCGALLGCQATGGAVKGTSVTDDAGMAGAIDAALRKEGGPSAACALLLPDGTRAIAARGSSLEAGGTEVTTRSLYNIGSVTKSFTALLAAQLVEEGRLSYETTLAEALPGVPMRGEFAKATILDLILSRAGIIPFQLTARERPEDVAELWQAIPARHPGNARAQRRAAAEYALALEPHRGASGKIEPVYSNVGWAVLGHAIEVAAGASYEELLERRILAPLGMARYKIGGWPADDYSPAEPVGHFPPAGRGGRPRPMSAADDYVFPLWMNPSGGLNLDVESFAAYAAEQLAGLRGAGKLLGAAGYARMHRIEAMVDSGTMYQAAPSGSAVGLGHGWAIAEAGGGTASIAEGSGGTFFALVAVHPGLGLAFVGLSNSGAGIGALAAVLRAATGFSL